MFAAFPPRPPVQLDNIIVYTGPPAAERKIRPPRPVPTPRERGDSLPPVATRTVGVCGENGSRTDTSTPDYIDLTSTFPTPITGEPASRKGLFDTSTRPETEDYHSVADMAFCTAIWPGLWDDVDISSIDAENARNEPSDSPSCSTVDVHFVCASANSSAVGLLGPKQRTLENIEAFTHAESSLGPDTISKSPSPAVVRAHACSANTTAPADGSVGRDRRCESARVDQDDASVAVNQAILDFPGVTPTVWVALEEGQPHQTSSLVMRDSKDENWVQDQDAMTNDDATLVLVGDHSCSPPGRDKFPIHESIRAGRATISDELGGAGEENGTCDSSDDDDIVPWIQKRRRALLAGSASAERRDYSQPPIKRRRRQTHTAELAVTSAPCRTADSQLSTHPTGRYLPAARSRPRKTIVPTATSTQDEWPVPPRALESESEPTWDVDRIVGSARKHGKDYYKVLWKPTWEPAESLQGTADTAVAEYRLSNRCRRVCWPKSGSK